MLRNRKHKCAYHDCRRCEGTGYRSGTLRFVPCPACVAKRRMERALGKVWRRAA